jgi:RNA polymerase sigma-70 factor (ECF subfamily)
MSDWQSAATYNKIAVLRVNRSTERMSAEQSEIDRLNTLDPLAITAMHDRYYPEVYRFARFRVNDQIVAEDIAGDVFMRLLEAVHAGKGPHTNLRGWLLRTTANIVNDHYRQLYNRPKTDPPDILENNGDLFVAQSDPVILTDEAERSQRLQLAIDELTEAQKLVITLRFGSRLSLEETAQVMNKSVNTIKALQFRALAALRRKLGNDLV